MSKKTIHKSDCKRVFNRYDSTCPRCQELIGGAKPREGWGGLRDQRYLEPHHPGDHEYMPNLGGYCYVCGWGRDFS